MRIIVAIEGECVHCCAKMPVRARQTLLVFSRCRKINDISLWNKITRVRVWNQQAIGSGKGLEQG